MVAGSAALLLKARPALSPSEVKSLLMNTGETNIGINPVGLPGVLAPITRIGGGEVRVDKAVASQTAAWDKDDEAGSLSFGYSPTVEADGKLKRKVVVRNYGATARTYAITPASATRTTRRAARSRSRRPASIKVQRRQDRASSTSSSRSTRASCRVWTLNGGPKGGDGYRLQGVEFDGYINLDGGAEQHGSRRVAGAAAPRRRRCGRAEGRQARSPTGPAR